MVNFCVLILRLKMEEKNSISAYYDYYFSKGKNATEAYTHTHTNLCNILKRGCDLWNHMFSMVCEVLCWDFSLDNAQQSSRPAEVDNYQIKTLTENDQHYTMHGITAILKISKSSFEIHLHWLVCVNHLDVWVPHKLSKKKKKRERKILVSLSVCHSLLKHSEKYSVFKTILWLVMKRRHCTIMWKGRDHGANKMNHRQSHQSPIFIQTRWYYVYGRIVRKFFILRPFHKTKWLIP